MLGLIVGVGCWGSVVGGPVSREHPDPLRVPLRPSGGLGGGNHEPALLPFRRHGECGQPHGEYLRSKLHPSVAPGIYHNECPEECHSAGVPGMP